MLRFFGGVEIDGHGAIRSPAQRKLLSALALDMGHAVSSDRLAELIWHDAQPDNPSAALQNQVSRVRSALPPGVSITAAGPGYRLDADADHVDVAVFDAAFQLACSGSSDERLEAIDAGLSLWRGSPFVDLADDDRCAAESVRLDAVRLSLRELKAETLLDEQRVHEAITELEQQRSEAPLRERTVELLMRAHVDAGHKSEALAAFQSLRAAMIDELGLDPSPELRQLEEDILTEEVVATRDTPRAAASSRERPRSEVTVPPSSFVGRAEDLDRVVSALSTHRIVSIVGPGGVGKTRLATHAAAVFSAAITDGGLDDGVCIVELTAIRDPSHFAELLASALDLQPRTNMSPIDLVLDASRHLRMLLVLDNCEHIIEAPADFAEAATRRAPGVRILATSREPLNIDGERVVRLQPLEATTDAVVLFADRAGSRGDFVLDDETRPLVERICVALDGLPLAVELAAARSAAMTLSELIDGLDKRFELFTHGRRTAHERHRSLGAMVEWSINSLPDELLETLTRVSVFASPFRTADAAAITCRSEVALMSILGELVERSLLVEHRLEGQPTRYGFLETIQAFVAELLVASDASDGTVERHSTWVLDRVEQMRDLMPDRPDGVAAGVVMSMLSDVRSAHRRFVESGDVDRSLRLAAGLHFLALFRMQAEMFSWIAETADRFGDADHVLTEDVLGSASIGKWVAGDLDGARELAMRAERRAATSSHPGAGRCAAEAAGDVLQFDGHDREALSRFDAAVELAEVQGDMARVACNLADGSMIAAYLGEHGRARSAIERARQIVGEHGSDLMEAWISYAEGEGLAEIDPDSALEPLSRAIALADEHSLHFIMGVAELTRTGLYVRSGDVVRAAPALVDLLERWRRTGAAVQQEITLRTVVELLVRIGRLDDAAVVLGAVLASGRAEEASGPDATRIQHAREAVLAGANDPEQLLGRGASIGIEAAAEVAMDALRSVVVDA